MRVYEYLQGILGALGVGDDNGVPTPAWRIEEYLKDIYDAIRSGIYPSDEQVAEAIDAWLDDHPEATTTVQDGAITKAKLNSALSGSIASDYSTSATYAVGDYVWYNGSLYRCATAITTAEAWTAAHWTLASLGNDVAGLKSAFNINYNNSVDYQKNYFDKNTVTSGSYIRGTDGAIVAKTGWAYSDYIPVSPGCLLQFSFNYGSGTYGYAFYSADKTKISSAGLNTISTPVVVPNGAFYLRTSVDTGTLDWAAVYVVPPSFHNANAQVRYAVEPAGATVNDYKHNAFPAIIQFHGDEIIAFRSAPAHATGETLGGISLFKRDKRGIVKFVKTITTGSFTGELRDPGLSVSPDGEKLFLSCFTTYQNDASKHDNVILQLDADLEVVATYIDSNVDTLFWGKTLFTPTNHVLHVGYKSGDGIYLYRSNEVFGDVALGSLTFTSSKIVSVSNGTECDIGYVSNYLAVVLRRETPNAMITKTTNLEGTDGWDSVHSLGLLCHAPKILEFCNKGDYLLFCGAYYVSSTVRKPVIALYKPATNTLIQYKLIDTEFDSYGCYCDFVIVSDFVVDIVWYNEPKSTNTTTVFIERLNLREELPAINHLM